jgi:leucyl aminopeptidase (aminopeptidase T)
MPGFSPEMVPALRLDYREVDRRCRLLKDLLDKAQRAELVFLVGGEWCELSLDLRHRQAHASGGLLPEPGTAGNLPSGETYIVPYEGEREGVPSRSEGRLPVQLPPPSRTDRFEGETSGVGGEVVTYRIRGNRAVGVEPNGPVAAREAERLEREPAYGNLAELGLGVLADFGLEPIGSVLLDEKLGLHIAFGRSDHFGGSVGPEDFSSPSAVVHIDRVYLPATQPEVVVEEVNLVMEDGSSVPLMRDGRYVIDFD